MLTQLRRVSTPRQRAKPRSARGNRSLRPGSNASPAFARPATHEARSFVASRTAVSRRSLAAPRLRPRELPVQVPPHLPIADGAKRGHRGLRSPRRATPRPPRPARPRPSRRNAARCALRARARSGGTSATTMHLYAVTGRSAPCTSVNVRPVSACTSSARWIRCRSVAAMRPAAHRIDLAQARVQDVPAQAAPSASSRARSLPSARGNVANPSLSARR